jgi:hypothetical protein
MAKKRKKSKTKPKVITRYIKPVETDFSPKIKDEIKELQEKKAKIGGGFRGTLQKATINRAIYDKQKYLKSRESERNLGAATQSLKKRIEFEKARGELRDIQKRNQVDFSGLGGFQSSPKKDLKFENLF